VQTHTKRPGLLLVVGKLSQPCLTYLRFWISSVIGLACGLWIRLDEREVYYAAIDVAEGTSLILLQALLDVAG
jgi:hypothetical protein